ncbi:hypothetical protein [Pseudoclavibacter helvolus]|uniref:hypothetical protein n=1 Tax=Pseudoclavibacter helvolus TaxID=255205 RepID=UPI003C77C6E7
MRYARSIPPLLGAVGLFVFPTALLVFWEPLFGAIEDPASEPRRVRQGLTFMPVIIPALYVMSIVTFVQFLRKVPIYVDRASGAKLRRIWDGARHTDIRGAEVLHRGFLYAEPRYYTPNVNSTSKRYSTRLTLWEVPGERRAYAAVAYARKREEPRIFPVVALAGAQFDVLEHQRSLFHAHHFMLKQPSPKDAAHHWDVLAAGGAALGERPPAE